MYMSPDARAAFQPIYTRHLLDEIGRMADVIPHDQLAYQWDVAPEVLMWEGVFEQPDTYKTDILDSLGEMGNAVPGTIELGYHLCYGSPRNEHVVQPRDLAVSVEIANGILERVERPVQFIHMPVPQDRNDDAFFQPLANLSLPEGTDLYLGCVQRGDDAGNAVKLDKARAYTHVAGISSECGWGRGDPANLDAILAAHKTLAQHVQPG